MTLFSRVKGWVDCGENNIKARVAEEADHRGPGQSQKGGSTLSPLLPSFPRRRESRPPSTVPRSIVPGIGGVSQPILHSCGRRCLLTVAPCQPRSRLSTVDTWAPFRLPSPLALLCRLPVKWDRMGQNRTEVFSPGRVQPGHFAPQLKLWPDSFAGKLTSTNGPLPRPRPKFRPWIRSRPASFGQVALIVRAKAAT